MADIDTLATLKKALADQLTDETTDFEAILRLAGQISEEEPDVVRFSTDAAMVRRLGRELVAKQETALGELVKNAYDADATVCRVDLVDYGDFEGFEIVDDGSGMTREELVNGFMRLASDSKVRNPKSPKFGRSRAGKKGIGRFATERLGQRLTVMTQTEHDSQGWTVEIDWDAFETGSDIGLVANRIVRSNKERPHGTRLSICGLKDGWSDADLRRVYRYLSTLLQPNFEHLQSSPDAEPGEDPGFKAVLSRWGVDLDSPTAVADADTEILGQALATIDARIDTTGKAFWSLSCARFELEVTDEPIGLGKTIINPVDHARDVTMKAWYFIQSREFLGHSTSFIGDVLNEHGGIKVYRNGYRVPPYGEKHDDWLGLDVKRTSTYAPINSKTFLGFVALTDSAGALFEETSSREGLIETEAFGEVREIMSRVLEAAARRIESRRGLGRKPKPRQDENSGDRTAQAMEAAANDVDDLLAEIDKSGPDGPLDPDRRERLSETLGRLSAAARSTAEVARERDDLLKELNLMRILASMGLTIAEFTHDFSALAETMELNLNNLVRSVPAGADRFDEALGRFRNQFRQVRAYTAHFGSMMTSNKRRELEAVDLYAFARGFAEDMEVMFDKRGQELLVERPTDYDIRTTDMHPSEWSSILLNLTTNAVKATARAARPGRFLIRVGRLDGGMVFLDFSDNGDGIPSANRPHVFDAFFTTSGGAPIRASESAQALGTGLGLKIVADIASAAGGAAMVLDVAPEGYETCIRVVVPAAPNSEFMS